MMRLLFIISLSILVMVFLISYCLFLFVFYVPPRKNRGNDKINLPKGKIYEPFWEQMQEWVIKNRNTPHEEFSITSFDGLKLYGNFYEYAHGAPIELMFHGYRGTAERDLSGGVQRCFQLGHSAFIVDQRCAGKSEGNVITFGINEHKDCLAWINFLIAQFGVDVQIILTGISMGASTVLMASGCNLPENVIGILADCGFHSPKDVICSVAEGMHLPSGFLYPFIKLGARIFGHFDLEALSAVEAVKQCNIPVIFFHGEEDDYVPSYMSQINYDACNARKKLIFIAGAGHGLSYPVSPDRYLSEVHEFFHGSSKEKSATS